MSLKYVAAAEMISEINRIANDGTLWLEKNFVARSEAIDQLEFHIIERINALHQNSDSPEWMNELKNNALRVRAGLEEVNAKMFHRIRTRISRDGYCGQRLRNLMDEHLDQPVSSFFQSETVGYDNLDLLLNGVLTPRKIPLETKEREPEMVFYQKTPARIVFELIERAAFKPGDVFFDLGSGPGQVVMLVKLLANVISIGIEYEPAFCAYAKACAAELHLDTVDFMNIDARDADYSTGTAFFMYTPFEGKMLRDTIEKLYGEALKRKIRIFTYGPCTPEVAKEEWLIQTSDSTGKLGAFRSV